MPQEPKRQDVTLVTRNDKAVWMELVLTGIALYYVTHPDIFDRIKDAINEQLDRIIHRFSIWETKQAIYNLPETDEPLS